MKSLAQLALALLLVTLLSDPALAQIPSGLTVGVDTLERIDGDTGERLWRVRHPSVWKTVKKEFRSAEVVGPVPATEGFFYAFGAWLVRIDGETGVIQEKISFPAQIVEMKPVDELLELTIEYPGHLDAEDTRTTMRWRPGTTAPAESWEMMNYWRPRRDVEYLAAPLGEPDKEFTEAERRDAMVLIRQQRAQDPKNPFYDFFLGEQLSKLGDATAADKHFAAAVKIAGAHWADDLQLAMMLDAEGRYDLADAAFDRAIQKVGQEHPTLQQSWSLVAHALLMGIWSRDSIERALAAKDFVAVDRMQSRSMRMFPHIEQSSNAWRLLADWYTENDQPELAKKWRDNAKLAAKAPWSDLGSDARRFDLALVLFLGFTSAFWLVAFLIGLRSPASKRSKWLPRTGKADAVGLVLVLLLPMPALWVMGTSVSRIGTLAEAPLDLIHGSFGSPHVSNWLQQRAPSNAREQLLDHSKALQHAYKTGDPVPAPLDAAPSLIAATVNADAAAATMTSAFGRAPLAARFVEIPPIEYLIPPWAILAALLMLAGAGIRNGWPRLTQALRLAIPGGATSAAAISGLLVGLTIAALASILFGFDSILQQIAMPAFGKYFGLGELYPLEDFAPSHAWAWVTLLGVFVVHGATTWFDRRD